MRTWAAARTTRSFRGDGFVELWSCRGSRREAGDSNGGQSDPSQIVELMNQLFRARFLEPLDQYGVRVAIQKGDVLTFGSRGGVGAGWVDLTLRIGSRWEKVRLGEDATVELRGVSEKIWRMAGPESWVPYPNDCTLEAEMRRYCMMILLVAFLVTVMWPDAARATDASSRKSPAGTRFHTSRTAVSVTIRRAGLRRLARAPMIQDLPCARFFQKHRAVPRSRPRRVGPFLPSSRYGASSQPNPRRRRLCSQT